jgi:CHASE3 domain sensor protein
VNPLASDGNFDRRPSSGPDRLNAFLSNRFLVVMLSLGLTLSIIGIGTFALRSHLASQSVVTSSKIREVAESFLGALRTSEAAQRGFLISGDQDYLTSFESASLLVQTKLLELSGLAWTTDEEGAKLEEIRVLTDRKISSLRTTIELKKQGRESDVLDIFKAEFANETTRKIAKLTGDMMIAESLKISSARRSADQANQRLGFGVLVLLLCIALLIVILFRRSRFEIESLNERQAVLDGLVRERTAAL